eukprot:gene6431-7093_t
MLLHPVFPSNKHPLEKSGRVEDAITSAKTSQFAMLSYCWLMTMPSPLWSDEDLTENLKRLDLSHNHITEIPKQISNFVNLREIWLSHNPLTIFPAGLLMLKKLEVIDISHTQIAEIPTLVIDLEHLLVFDWRHTPLEKHLWEDEGIACNDLHQLQTILWNQNLRNKTCATLNELFNGEIYLQDVDKSYTIQTIATFVEELSQEFDDLTDFESFSRRPIKFVPAKVDDIKPSQSAKRAKQLFYEMKREIDRKRLAADLEIKIRGHYYDKIERSEVTDLIDSIYANVETLEDMQFLVQYASTIFPPEHKGLTGQTVWQNILSLQDDLIHKREAAVNTLAKALTGLYPEQKPEVLNALAREVNAHRIISKERFATQKELVRMAQLAGDCSKVFPPDFASVHVPDILQQARSTIFQ